MPVPAPATLDLMLGMPTRPSPLSGELVTPTGACLLKTLCLKFGPPPPMTPLVVGYGAGTKEFGDTPNLLRVVIGESVVCGGRMEGIKNGFYVNDDVMTVTCKSVTMASSSDVMLIETNIDDETPEVIAYVSDRLFDLNIIIDCWRTSVIMKKGRIGILLSILCLRDRVSEVCRFLFTETSTIGARIRPCERQLCDRETKIVNTKYGPISVKIATYENRIVNVKPEYEQCRAAAVRHGVSVKGVMNEVRGKACYLYDSIKGEESHTAQQESPDEARHPVESSSSSSKSYGSSDGDLSLTNLDTPFQGKHQPSSTALVMAVPLVNPSVNPSASPSVNPSVSRSVTPSSPQSSVTMEPSQSDAMIIAAAKDVIALLQDY